MGKVKEIAKIANQLSKPVMELNGKITKTNNAISGINNLILCKNSLYQLQKAMSEENLEESVIHCKTIRDALPSLPFPLEEADDFEYLR